MTDEELINSFNLGDYDEDIKPYFNDIITFFSYAKKNNFLNELDINEIPYNEFDQELFEFLVDNNFEMNYFDAPEEFQNYILLYDLKRNPEETLKFVTDHLVTDVEFKNGGYYLRIDDRAELSNLFKDYGRDTSPHDVAKAVLSGDFWEAFSDTTYNVYEDVIEELDDENINYLAHYIVKEIGDEELSLEDYEDDFFHEVSNEQGTEGFFKITSENVMDLINNESAMQELLKDHLSDLKSELYSIHYNAYNSAYENEIYEDVWNELETYFEKNIETETKELSDGKTRYYEYVKIKDFNSFVYEWAEHNEGETFSTSFLEYYGDYIRCMKQLMEDGVYDWLNFRISDYPDFTMVNKAINEMFGDYI